jgi:hypothetical protein
MAMNKHCGSSFEDFLREDGLLDEVQALAVKKTMAAQAKAAKSVQRVRGGAWKAKSPR